VLLLVPPEFGEMRLPPVNLMVSFMVSRHGQESDTIIGQAAGTIKVTKGCSNKRVKPADSDGRDLLAKPTGRRYSRMNYRFSGFQKMLAFEAWSDF
jgi:hypothetical protein